LLGLCILPIADFGILFDLGLLGLLLCSWW